MENLTIKGLNKFSEGYCIPHIEFNAATGQCDISGGSFLEDSIGFYLKLEDWIEDYIKENHTELTLNFKLTYFNTSSAKSVFSLLQNLSKHQEKGERININWHYADEDVDSLEDAEDLISETGVRMNLVIDNNMGI